ncbi:MAG TPA: type II toxin-antitoxin system HicA family toxin [Patescibacteria group bacterium]|nr:type II toxin-antitoxin system HicA family toxin [Patescibacteria group bacterium]
MPKLYSSVQIIKVLLKLGFAFVSQRGSHAKYRKTSKSVLTVIIPVERKEVPRGTFRSILRQAGLTETEFKKIK